MHDNSVFSCLQPCTCSFCSNFGKALVFVLFGHTPPHAMRVPTCCNASLPKIKLHFAEKVILPELVCKQRKRRQDPHVIVVRSLSKLIWTLSHQGQRSLQNSISQFAHVSHLCIYFCIFCFCFACLFSCLLLEAFVFPQFRRMLFLFLVYLPACYVCCFLFLPFLCLCSLCLSFILSKFFSCVQFVLPEPLFTFLPSLFLFSNLIMICDLLFISSCDASLRYRSKKHRKKIQGSLQMFRGPKKDCSK